MSQKHFKTSNVVYETFLNSFALFDGNYAYKGESNVLHIIGNNSDNLSTSESLNRLFQYLDVPLLHENLVQISDFSRDVDGFNITFYTLSKDEKSVELDDKAISEKLTGDGLFMDALAYLLRELRDAPDNVLMNLLNSLLVVIHNQERPLLKLVDVKEFTAKKMDDLAHVFGINKLREYDNLSNDNNGGVSIYYVDSQSKITLFSELVGMNHISDKNLIIIASKFQ